MRYGMAWPVFTLVNTTEPYHVEPCQHAFKGQCKCSISAAGNSVSHPYCDHGAQAIPG